MSELIKLELTPEEAHILHGFMVNAINLASETVREAVNAPNHKEQALIDMLASISACENLGLIEIIDYLKEQAERIEK